MSACHVAFVIQHAGAQEKEIIVVFRCDDFHAHTPVGLASDIFKALGEYGMQCVIAVM